MSLLESLFSYTRNLHMVLQERGQYITKSLRIPKRLEEQLDSANTEEKAIDFYRITKVEALIRGCDLPILRRGSRKCVRGLDQYSPIEECELKSAYRNIYLEVVEFAKNALAAKIMSSGLERLSDIESLLCEPTDVLWLSVIPTIKSDINAEELKIELPRFINEVKQQYGADKLTSNKIESIDLQIYELYPNVKLLVTFLRTSFVSSSEAERSFSAMRRINTYLRKTMNDSRMTRLAICHLHFEELDKLNSKEVINEWIKGCPGRSHHFSQL